MDALQLMLMLAVFIINGVTVMDVFKSPSLDWLNKSKTCCEMALMSFSLLPMLRVSLSGVMSIGVKGCVVTRGFISQPDFLSLCHILKAFPKFVGQKLCGSPDISKRMSEEI